ncbi:MAG: hypothetical protein DRH79_07520, partial [Candidatus Cloacimonadota bacterium]
MKRVLFFILLVFAVTSIFSLVLIYEDFEGSTSFPDGWTQNSSYVQNNASNANSGTYYAGMNRADDWIQLPNQDKPGDLTVWVRTSSDPDNWIMAIQKNTGSDWQNVKLVTENGAGGEISNSYSQIEAQIRENQNNVQIRFILQSRSAGSC